MRPIVLLGPLAGLVLLLPGCSGFGTFLSDTHWTHAEPNAPLGESENIQRVRGMTPILPPLQTQAGNVWPGPLPPEPSLSQLQKTMGTQSLGGAGVAPVAPLTHRAMPVPSGTPSGGAPAQNGSTSSSVPVPNNSAPIVVPNGNGTSTVIEPDGTVRTIPTPK